MQTNFVGKRIKYLLKFPNFHTEMLITDAGCKIKVYLFFNFLAMYLTVNNNLGNLMKFLFKKLGVLSILMGSNSSTLSLHSMTFIKKKYKFSELPQH